MRLSLRVSASSTQEERCITVRTSVSNIGKPEKTRSSNPRWLLGRYGVVLTGSSVVVMHAHKIIIDKTQKALVYLLYFTLNTQASVVGRCHAHYVRPLREKAKRHVAVVKQHQSAHASTHART